MRNQKSKTQKDLSSYNTEMIVLNSNLKKRPGASGKWIFPWMP